MPNHYLAEMVDALAHGVRLARAGSADQRPPALPHRDRRPDDPLPARAVRRARGHAAAARPHLPRLVRRLPRHDRPLIDPSRTAAAEDAFSLVIPSMPGFGFSTPVADGGWTMARVARTYDTLMRRLGYDSYGIHGSDGGAMVARELGLLDPPGFLGAHVLQLFSFPSGDPAEFESSSPRTTPASSTCSGSSPSAATTRSTPPGRRPSPSASPTPRSGQLAWNELFNSFGNGTSLVSRDQILDPGHAVVVHQHLGHGGPLPLRGGARRRRSRRSAPRRPASRCSPTTSRRSRSFAERDNTNIVHWSDFDRGGHYAAMEVPDVLAADIRAFFG